MRHVCWTGAESQCCCPGHVRVCGFTDSSDALQLKKCSLWLTNTNPVHIVKEISANSPHCNQKEGYNRDK